MSDLVTIPDYPVLTGIGKLSGYFDLDTLPGGIIYSDITIRAYYIDPLGGRFNGVQAAYVSCQSSGRWLIDGINEHHRYNVVISIPGYNDIIYSNKATSDSESPDYGNFKVRTAAGEILELDLTNAEQVEEWKNNDYISFRTWTTIDQLKVVLSTVEEVISYGGPQIHTKDKVIDISGYRLGTPNLIKIPDYLPEWVTDMSYFLYGSTKFNQPLNLDTSNVTNMYCFLLEATSFNSSINLDTSNVTDMGYFLRNASSFNQPLELNTSKVTDMSRFLQGASSFNQDLSHLCVPLITKEPANFDYGATAYTKPRPIWGTCPAV